MKKRFLTSCFVALMSVISVLPAFAGQWQQDQRGWLYQQDDGNYASNTWVNHGGVWYFINSSGVMVANQFVGSNGASYYVDGSGSMVTGWQQFGSEWYYFFSDGHMATGVQTVDGVSQFFTAQGVWVKDADTNNEQSTGEAVTMDSLFNAAYKGIEWDEIENLSEKYYSNFYSTTVDVICVLNSWRDSNNSKNLDFSSTLSKAAFALAISNRAEDYLGADNKSTVGVTEYEQCLTLFDASTDAVVLATEGTTLSRAIQKNYNRQSLEALYNDDLSKIGIGFARRENGNILLVILMQ